MTDKNATTPLPYILLDELGRVREIGFRGEEAFERLRVYYKLPPLESLMAAGDRTWLDSEGKTADPLEDDFTPAGHGKQPHLNAPRAFRVYDDHYYLRYVSLTPGHHFCIQPDRDERAIAGTPTCELSFLLRTRSAKDDYNWIVVESDLFGEDEQIEIIVPGEARVSGDPDAPSRIHPVGHVRALLKPFGEELRAQQAAAIRAEEAALEAERIAQSLTERAATAFESLPAYDARATNPRDTLMMRVRSGSKPRKA